MTASMEYPAACDEQQGELRTFRFGERHSSSRQNNYTSQFVVDGSGGRRQEAVETDPHRIAQRQKQIDYGKNTLGYQRYTEEVPRYLRRKISTKISKHPDTPDVTQICSKRSFDGQAKKWRRELHLWDPEGEDDLLEPVMQIHAQHAAAQPDLAQPNVVQPNLAQQAAAESLESPEASGAAAAAAYKSPTTSSPPPTLSQPPEAEARPSSFLSPKKQKTGSGHTRPMPPRHGGSIVGENVLPSEVPRKPLSTGSKRSYQDMDTEAASSGQAFEEHSRAQAGSEEVQQEEDKLAPWNDITPEDPSKPVAAPADNRQPDDIFGPAHEFD